MKKLLVVVAIGILALVAGVVLRHATSRKPTVKAAPSSVAAAHLPQSPAGTAVVPQPATPGTPLTVSIPGLGAPSAFECTFPGEEDGSSAQRIFVTEDKTRSETNGRGGFVEYRMNLGNTNYWWNTQDKLVIKTVH